MLKLCPPTPHSTQHWTQHPLALALWATSLSTLSSSSSLAARVAVLAVPGDDPAAAALAERMRGLLPKTDVVVDAATLSQRLRGPVGAAVDVAVQRAAAAAADAAFDALEHERSVALLDDVIEQLEADRDFSVDKAVLLEQSRLTCAQRLVGLAGPTETGNGETKNGARARAHLGNLLRANPTLVLDASRYPPKMRSLLQKATDDVKGAGHGGLAIRSTPEGAVVFVEGRALGPTPLNIAGVIPVGQHRLWLELAGRRSITRVVDVAAGFSVPVEIDIGFEGSLQPGSTKTGPGLSPLVPFDEPAWKRLAGFVDVDVVVAVGQGQGQAQGQVWALAAEVAGPLRTGTVVAGQDREGALLAFVRGQAGVVDVAGVVAGGVPAEVAAAVAVAAVEPPGEFPWVLAGVGAVGAVVVAGAVTAGVVYATRQINSTIGVSFGDPP